MCVTKRNKTFRKKQDHTARKKYYIGFDNEEWTHPCLHYIKFYIRFRKSDKQYDFISMVTKINLFLSPGDHY